MEEDVFDLEGVDLRVPEEIRKKGVVGEHKSSTKEEYIKSITAKDFEMIERMSEFFMQEDAKTLREARNYIVH